VKTIQFDAAGPPIAPLDFSLNEVNFIPQVVDKYT
jgi:hypothetical protein